MKILLTGATGYVGKRLLPVLVKSGHKVVCCARDVGRFHPSESLEESISIIEIDLLDRPSLAKIPKDIDAAYYLVHSMSSSSDYEDMERRSAMNFREAVSKTNARQVIYLGGIANEKTLSKHLGSRKRVEDELSLGEYHFTALRAGIIVGAGSASFEIIRDLVEKLPIMVAPKWLRTLCQPIAIADVVIILEKTLGNKKAFDDNFDIGGEDILSYRDMLLLFAKVRGLKRRIFILPVMSPRLSSYWLYFITAISYKLANALVESMKMEVLCRDDRINHLLNIRPIGYEEALVSIFEEVEHSQIISSWKDSLVSADGSYKLSDFIQVPGHGCFSDQRSKSVKDKAVILNRIWSIGGKGGWYYANWLWRIRGFLDKIAGGVGLRRGRTNEHEIAAGDAIDFWRVLYANKNEGRLLLFAEMKLPGEAWLEFKLEGSKLRQTATFRPRGLLGRLYWFSVYPLHGILFTGMLNKLTE
ncbi:MAG: SDR family oxidoreductase [Verrucomicrobia bacterium]|nr:SDR family oxidoreductase [Verrucomicrobiota bacterium]MDA1065624.1 SDR family oxidoreductase [Verrucomicrobiota bacterium]